MRERGYYGRFGGAYIPEILVPTFDELAEAFAEAQADPAFLREYEEVMASYSCRPTPLTFAGNLTAHFGGARIYIKREDLNHTGAHKANNVMGQGLLVRRMGKRRVIAETGAGQHGVATATMAARFGLECTVYMGEVDVHRQRPNVFWMQQLGAEVVPVTQGTRILKDAINEAFRDWVTNMESTHYVLGTACGPHPFPEMVAWFQSILGREARRQVLEQTGRARFEAATDDEVVEAMRLTMRKEGLIPALESAHAFVQAFKEAPTLGPDDVVVVNQSGRGDKDIFTVADAFQDPGWREFIRAKAAEYGDA
jgi:tryptophan synthase beta chain